MGHMSYDKLHLGVKVFWGYFHKSSVSVLINQWINDRGVCRTALATQGLIKRLCSCIFSGLGTYQSEKSKLIDNHWQS